MKIIALSVIGVVLSGMGCANTPETEARKLVALEEHVEEDIAPVYEMYERFKSNKLEAGDIYQARLSFERAQGTLLIAWHRPKSNMVPVLKRLRKRIAQAKPLVERMEVSRQVIFVGGLNEDGDGVELEWTDKNGRTLSEEEARAL